jgi:hypothetical protein
MILQSWSYPKYVSRREKGPPLREQFHVPGSFSWRVSVDKRVEWMPREININAWIHQKVSANVCLQMNQHELCHQHSLLHIGGWCCAPIILSISFQSQITHRLWSCLSLGTVNLFRHVTLVGSLCNTRSCHGERVTLVLCGGVINERRGIRPTHVEFYASPYRTYYWHFCIWAFVTAHQYPAWSRCVAPWRLWKSPNVVWFIIM